jgi:hypothetical protein
MDIIEKLEDLYKQATAERSHFYVAGTAMEAMQIIHKYRAALVVIAAQDSGKIGSTDKVDCMATIAQTALR